MKNLSNLLFKSVLIGGLTLGFSGGIDSSFAEDKRLIVPVSYSGTNPKKKNIPGYSLKEYKNYIKNQIDRSIFFTCSCIKEMGDDGPTGNFPDAIKYSKLSRNKYRDDEAIILIYYNDGHQKGDRIILEVSDPTNRLLRSPEYVHKSEDDRVFLLSPIPLGENPPIGKYFIRYLLNDNPGKSIKIEIVQSEKKTESNRQ